MIKAVLRKILPYFGVSFRITPIAHVCEKDGGWWTSTGEDPCFLLSAFAGAYPTGWAMLDVELTSSGETALFPILYIDDGQGFREALTLKIPQNRKGGGTHALIKLPPVVRGLRFDPLAGRGDFILTEVCARAVSKFELVVRVMLPRLVGLLRNPAQIPEVWVHWRDRLREEGLGGVKDRLLGGHKAVSSYADWITLHDSFAPVERKWIESKIRTDLGARFHFMVVQGSAGASAVAATRLALERQFDSGWKLWTDAEAAASQITDGLDWVGFFEPGTRFARHAVFVLRDWVARHPEARFFYFDEDSIDAQGQRSAPFFKPDWNEEYQLEAGYLGTSWFVRADVFRASKLKRVREESAYQRAMALLAAIPRKERLAGAIVHHPGILAHVPVDRLKPRVECLTAIDSEVEAARDYLTANGLEGEILPRIDHGTLHFLPRVPSPVPLVSIIIGTRDRLQILRGVVEGILEKTDYPNLEVIIVDNQSCEPETLAYFHELEKIAAPKFKIVRYDQPFNFSAIQNFGVEAASGDVYAFLNNDLEMIRPDWLKIMVGHAMRPDVGAVGARLLYANNTVQHGGVILGIGGVAGHLLKYVSRETLGIGKRCRVTQTLSSVTAACLVIRRAVFEKVSGFDATNLPIAFNDVDFCLRIREAGFRNLLDPEAELYHLESVSRGSDDTPQRRAGFQKEIGYMLNRWEPTLRTDPAYNPNLSLIHEDFSLAFPPRVEKPWQSRGSVSK